MFSSKRAQASIETIIILAAVVLGLSFLAGTIYNQFEMHNREVMGSQASLAVNTLAKEANDAYFLGSGTVKNVLIILPDGVDLTKSFILGKEINLNVLGTDYFSPTSVEVRGVWPSVNGSYVFTITSYGDFVAVSPQNIYFSPAQLNLGIRQSASLDFDVNAVNASSSDLGYNLYMEFPSDGTSEVTISTASANPLIFLAGDNTGVSFNVHCSASSFGSYSGRLVFVPLYAQDVNLSVPISVVCSP